MKVSEHNKMVKYITDPRDRKSPEERAKITATQKANDAKRMAAKRKEYGLPDMNKHVIDTLNKYEDGPNIVEEVIRNSPVPVKVNSFDKPSGLPAVLSVPLDV